MRRAVGRVGALGRHVQRELLWQPAGGGHREDLREPRVGGAGGGKEHPGAVGRPAEHRVGGRVPRQPLRLTARGRHDEDIDVAVVFAGEGDATAVGRERGARLDAGARREPAGGAPLAGHAPQVAPVDEHDVGPAERRALHQQSVASTAPPRSPWSSARATATINPLITALPSVAGSACVPKTLVGFRNQEPGARSPPDS